MKTLAYVNRLVGPQRKLYVLSLVIWGTVFAVPLMMGLVIREFFDALADPQASLFSPYGWIALLIGVSLVEVVSLVLGFFYDFTIRIQVATLLRKNLFAYLLNHPNDRIHAGEALSRFRDDVNEISNFVSFTTDLFFKPVYVFISLAIMFFIHAKLTLVVVIPLLIVFLMANKLKRKVEGTRQKSSQATSQVTRFLGDVFNSVQVIKANQAENKMVERLQQLSEERRKWMVKDRYMGELLTSLFSYTVSLVTALILLFGAESIQDGTFSLGDLSLFIFYLGMLTNLMSFLGRMMAWQKQADVSFRRLEALLGDQSVEVLMEEQEKKISEGAPVPTLDNKPLEHLEVRGLTYRHPETGKGIEGIDCTVKKGTLVAITGKIGSGKSTLLRTLLGQLPKESGEILWNGERVEEPHRFLVPPRCAYTPQVPQLFSDPLKENILLGVPEDEANLNQSVEMAVLQHDVEQLDHGLETWVGTQGVRLSGGQIQRAAAARMFMREAEIWVIDDLSSALDVKTEQQLWERLFQTEGATCLVVSHRPAVLQRADEILILEEGKVIARGDYETLSLTYQELLK
ncbi:ABC transporter ATP-binding protein [Hazenella coriacea]|uniref:ATP-binding cassette subfamily B protein n=1 Tax=Hazenella coriacea TaxID=1179467 RepID=A0A4V2UVR1_9BACL|nr:ABC transporter ATP-binding protein [Hazenella coriacea]TCS96797.1 ATP-binding cassette subfamily B protein [Hazenella coriacea]